MLACMLAFLLAPITTQPPTLRSGVGNGLVCGGRRRDAGRAASVVDRFPVFEVANAQGIAEVIAREGVHVLYTQGELG